MKTILTPHLLGFLIERGYTHCLAKTQSISKSNASVMITLTPVKVKPVLHNLPLGYDTYYKITREPMQMAVGIDDTEVYISLELKQNRFVDTSSDSKKEVETNSYAFE
ncbi:hypothetical protein [Daejeonella oryzae]|uniref:hypothetical protein n=1 Tax=Daejeonella oryzae TaxID=1122943 RepID=UPI0003FBDDBF|nr:hypothetical protein [Daejeonella oryzae]